MVSNHFGKAQRERQKYDFSTKELSPALKITFNNWSEVKLIEGSGYITGNVMITNTGLMTARDIILSVKVEDTSFGYNAEFCDFHGNALPYPQNQKLTYDFGDLPPGESTDKWSIAWLGSEESPGGGPIDGGESNIAFHFYPKFIIDYEKDRKRYTASTTLTESL